MRKTCITDLDACETLWNSLMVRKNVSDLWGFRLCFQNHFNYPPCFLLFEDRKGIAGVIPLSYVEDLDIYVFFPGEVWKGKTWIERTPIYSRNQSLLPELLSSCPERTYLRYMQVPEGPLLPGLEIDETGYLLHPPDLDFDLSLFRNRFPNKKFKAIMKVVSSFAGPASSFQLNRLDDFNALVEMSLQNFGTDSYLHDGRFREGFRDIMHFLHDNGWLRMVSLEIDGRVAAVDLGAIFGGTYTVFLGAAHPDFLGIAKAMNMHHIEFACEEGLSRVDFLCGDFHWKKLWHLDPEPLYKFVSPSLGFVEERTQEVQPLCPLPAY
jgi:hypothetical protein